MKKNELILSVRDLNIKFNLRGKILHAIRGIDLDVYHGEVLAIVGESGSGKSVFTKAFVGMLDVNGKITGGSILYEGRDMTKFTEKDWLGVRGKKIAMVMQDTRLPASPTLSIPTCLSRTTSKKHATDANCRRTPDSYCSVR